MATPSRREPLAEVQPWDAQDSLLRRVVASGQRLLRGFQAPALSPAVPSTTVPTTAATPAAEASPHRPAAPFSRTIWTDRLWGEGMAIPGGAEEVLRLAALLPLAPAHTVLLAGLGAQSAGTVISGARGCFVAAHDLIVPGEAAPRRRKPPKRVTAADFSPDAPEFRPAYHQHALLLEPFRHGGAPERLLRATASALRDSGEVVLLDLVAREPITEARWLKLEDRLSPPGETVMTRALEKSGFRVHVVEDAGARHQRSALLGWAALLEALRHESERPTPQAAIALVTEAEAWLLRLRLMQQGRLRLLRWHATMMRRPS